MLDMTTVTESVAEVPVDISLAEQLETVPDLGSEIDDGGFYARAADRPIAYSVSALFERLGNPVPDSTKLYERFELWLVPHRVSIIRRSGYAEATSVGIEVSYKNDGRTCSIVSLFPSFEYIEHGSVDLNVQARMSATGEIEPVLDLPATALLGTKVKCGASLQTSVGSGLSLRLAASVSTPSLSSVGIGASQCEWRLDKDKIPLFGRDIETWSVLALPKRQRELKYELRFYFIARTAFVPTRRQSDWVPINCSLEG